MRIKKVISQVFNPLLLAPCKQEFPMMLPLQLFYMINHTDSHLLLCGLREFKILAQLQLIVTEFVLV